MIAVDSAGILYVPDTGNNCIRRVTPDGIVTTIAGIPGAATGNVDGPGAVAQFNYPQGIVVDNSGVIFISDSGNNSIRKITPDLTVSTIYPTSPTDEPLNNPTGIDIDNLGNIYIADTSNNRIRILSINGEIQTLVGTKDPGYADSSGNAVVQFYFPTGVKYNQDKSIYVTDQYNNLIRKIALQGYNNNVLIDNGMMNRVPVDMSFNYADIALTPVYSDGAQPIVSVQNLNVSRSMGAAGQLGPTLSRAAGSGPPSIQGHRRGGRF
jgi:sugar lactone lactonase YvrE